MAFVSSWRWYGVRTLHKTVIDKDEPVQDESQLFTETISIVKAQSHMQACKIAERKAKMKKKKYKNIYGQTVSQQFVSIVDCYFIDEEPTTGTTVYTCQYKVPAGEEPMTDLIQRLMMHR